MADKKFSYQVGIEADGAIRGLNQIRRAAKNELGAVSEELKDGKSNAEAFADGMRAVAARIEQELAATESAAEKLGNALGPELRARLGSNGIEQMVADLRRGGLTFDEIEADAEQLAAAIERLDQAADGAGRKIATEMDTASASSARLATEADKTGSVMANTMGNSAQSLADSLGIAGVAGGSLGVTIGQLAEYSAEGGISLSQLAKQAGPMIAVTAAVAGIGYAIQRHKEEQEEVRRAIQATRQELEGLSAAASAGDLFSAQAMTAFSDSAEASNDELKELSERLKGTGVDTAGLAKALAGGRESLKSFLQTQADALGIGEEFATVMENDSTVISKSARHRREASEATRELFKIWKEGEDVVDVNTEALDRNSESMRAITSDAETLASTLRAASSSTPIADLLPPDVLSEISAELANGGTGAEAMARHSATLVTALGPMGATVLPKLVDELKATADEAAPVARHFDQAAAKARVLNDQMSALLGTIDAEQTFLQLQQDIDGLGEEFADLDEAVKTGEMTRGEAMRAGRIAILDQKAAVAEYVRQLGNIPPSKTTAIMAALDKADYETANRLLAELTQPRSVPIRILPGGDIAGTRGIRQSGGPVSSGGTYEVVEKGAPELYTAGGRTWMIPGEDGKVVPLERGSSAGSSAQVINITVQVAGSVLSEQDLAATVLEQLRRQRRRDGDLGL